MLRRVQIYSPGQETRWAYYFCVKSAAVMSGNIVCFIVGRVATVCAERVGLPSGRVYWS